jgi:hypothetical protein
VQKGKNFSRNNRGQRKKSDFYETPYSMTEHLVRNEVFDSALSVCEPACGDGAIVKVLKDCFDGEITSYDVEVDFLTETKQYNYIITNPPFSLALEFVKKAKTVATDKFALLLPLSYLHGKQRHDEVYNDRSYGLRHVHVFTRYPLLGEPLREDGKYKTGMMVYAWYVFENGYSGDPAIKWIDNNDDIYREKRKKQNEI